MKKILFLVAALSVSSAVHAGGYRVSLQGQKAQGMAHTGVAMAESAESVFFNPGSMAVQGDDSQFVGSINVLEGTVKYQNANTGTSAETDNPTGTPLNLYYSTKHSDKLAWGVGVYTPYGNKVKWQDDWAGSHLVNEIELVSVFVQPTISYRVSDTISIGFGPAFVSGAVEFNRNLSTSLTDENGDRSNVTLKASGVGAYGFNFGLLAKINDRTNFGVSYRSKVDLEARGESATFNNIPASLQATFSDTDFDADLVLPAELTLGVAHQVNDRLTLAFDANRTFWEEYEELRIEFDNSVPTSINPRNYRDSNIFRFGFQYRRNDAWTFRGGIYWDKTPVQDGYFAPETPRNDSTNITGGFTYSQNSNLAFDFSFLISSFSQVDNSYDFYVENGVTTPFEGTYKSSAFNLGFGMTYTY
ncbi:MAG: outer membrane protein transport protein [Pseudomonadota bacterium]